jgi:undecaprenyl diphosphate synthase
MFSRKKEVLPAILPTHISFIVDGNGRWAKKRGMPRNYGHKHGLEVAKQVIEYVDEFKIPYASFYCFSTENWKRDSEEVNGLFEIIRDELLVNFVDEYSKRNFKLVAYGDTTKFPKDLQDALNDAINKTKDNTGTTIILCLNYGGRDEILRAVNNIIKSGKKEVTLKDIEENLYSAGIPDPDFVVRTSGENRISNYMLYQLAYSELYFPNILWPDLTRKDFINALWEYAKRNRRFGGAKK